MTLRLATLFVALFLSVSPAFAADPMYKAEVGRLANGMMVVVVPVHRTPAVTHMVWYKAGSGEEPFGISGTAHFMEHLMFKGTPTMAPGAFSAAIQRMGGNDNAFTSWDYTAYHQTVPKEKLADVMKMEADRMNNLTPKLSDIESEHQVVMEERRQTTDGDPGAMLRERMNNVLFPNHPYGKPILGWMSEMKNLKWVDALAFYKKWYAPNNAILVISGDTTLAEVLPLAQATYGKLPAEQIPPRYRPDSPKLEGEVAIRFEREDVHQAEWLRSIRVPSAHQNPDISLDLELLEDLLGGSTGRLYQKLVVKDKIATAVGVSYNPYAIDDGTWTVYGAPAPGVSTDKLAAAMNAVLAEAGKTGFTDAEIKSAIARLQDASAFARDSLSGPAMNIGYELATGVPMQDIENWPTRLERVTARDAQNVLNTYVLGHNGVAGYLLPKGGK